MKGTCFFCERDGELRKSHIIPSFVYKWQKKTSATGRLREILQPNKPVQDGIKQYLFCHDCETRLNKWETIFAKKIFNPFNSGKANKEIYEGWFLKFCVSISWRVLLFFVKERKLKNDKSIILQQEIDGALKTWKEFLLDNRENPGKCQQHFLYLENMGFTNFSAPPTNINRYFLRTIHAAFGYTNDQAFVYSKLGHFLIIGFVNINQPRQWVNTRVHVKYGVIKPNEFTLPQYFGDFLKDQALKIKETRKKITSKQNEATVKRMQNNLDRLTQSETFHAMNMDFNLFGTAAFDDEDDESVKD